MNECLKLTTYFGEHDRSAQRLLADALFDLYERRRVHTSVMLRGVEGFGLGHALRTDRTLSLSEDLPVVSVALDTRERIETLLAAVLAIEHRGLVTLERARLLTGELGSARLPGELQAATKLTVYVGRRERAGRVPLFVAVCDLLHRLGMSGATVLLGVDGTSQGRRTRAGLFAGNREVPVIVISIGTGPQIEHALSRLGELVDRPVISLERIQLCKRDGMLLSRPVQLPGIDEHGLGLWQKLMVHASEDARFDGLPLHRALVHRLRAAGCSGATTVRGIYGFHGDHPPHGDKLLQVRRHVPTVTIVVERADRLAAAFEIVDEVTTERGLVTSETVPAATTVAEHRRRGGLRLALSGARAGGRSGG